MSRATLSWMQGNKRKCDEGHALQLVWYQDGDLRQFSFKWTSGIPNCVNVRSIRKRTETDSKGSCTTVHERQINQETINQQLTTPSISQEHVNCQGAITRPTTNRTMTSGRTQWHRTSIKRNREHQSHECLQSFLTHSTTTPGSTILRDDPPWDNVLMTTQLVMSTTNSNHRHPTVYLTQHFGRQPDCTLAMYPEDFPVATGWATSCTFPPSLRPGDLTSWGSLCSKKNKSSPERVFYWWNSMATIHNVPHQCWFIFGCKCAIVCTFCCNM